MFPYHVIKTVVGDYCFKNYVTKTIVGDYDLNFFKAVKTVVGVYGFRLKVKTGISEYRFNIFF